MQRRDLTSVTAGGAAALAAAQGREWLMFAGAYTRRQNKRRLYSQPRRDFAPVAITNQFVVEP